MNRLYLLGFTHDLKGVVFSQRKGAKNATLWIPVDATFVKAIEKLERARAEAAGGKKGKGKGAKAAREPEQPAKRVILPPVGRSQSTSRIPASEIQQLLREGRTVRSVVEVSKAPQAWVERLLEPVLTERGGVIRLAQNAMMSRPRLGKSGLPLGEAVLRNLEDRRATADTIEGIDDAWDARASHTGRWRIWVKFNHRGKRRTAEWNFNKSTRAVTPRNRLGAQLGWWPAEPGAAPEPIPALEGAETEASENGEAEARKSARKPAKRKRPRKPAPKTRRPAKKSAQRGPKRKPARRP
ncbi:MAG TPA: septation protein SepH [Actinomycetota bacterium]|nr:septation protein SepH [Actinomycetota bacterium]